MANQFPAVILLAEDDEDDVMLFRTVLQEIAPNTELRRAKDGEQLMQMLSDESLPDILFLDVMMPCKDGRQCIKEIRAEAAFDKLPVIVYSYLADPDIANFFYENGANAFMHKPYSFERLSGLLKSIFEDTNNLLATKPYNTYLLNPVDIAGQAD